MKILLSILSFFTLIITVTANPVTTETAKTVGVNFLLHKTSLPKAGLTTTDISLAYTAHNTFNPAIPTFYIFSFATKGFVIVAADDNVNPILGYSTESGFDGKQIPIQLNELLGTYAIQITYVVNNKITPTNTIKAYWAELLNPTKLSKYQLLGAPVIVSPMIQTGWDQGNYYNKFCPYDSQHGSTTLTGCVATTMAQIMKYWSFPSQGTGSHSYTPPDASLGVQSANFGNTTYQWGSMPYQLTSSSTPNQINAVATLMYDCGVSVEMQYGLDNTGGSLAYTISYGGQAPYCAENAFKNYFNYSNSVSGIQRSNYTDAQWISIIENELSNGRPVVYAGYNFNSTNGHAFIADGYDANNNLHFNWGWSGGYQGYFSIYSIVPYVIDTFTYYQQAIIGIKPNTNSTSTAVSICNNALPYSWNGKLFTKPGTYTDTITNANQTVTIQKLILTEKYTTNSTTSINICSGKLPYIWNGVSYSTGGTYTSTFTNAAGCDSIATLVLTIDASSVKTSSLTYNGCRSIYYNGKSYTASTVLRDTVKTTGGCDSIIKTVTINITVPTPPSITISASSNSIVSGTAVTFTTSVTNGGSSPVYQWKKNSVAIAGATSATYTTTTSSNNDTISCYFISSNSCVTTSTATSNKIVETVVYTISGNITNANGSRVNRVLIGLNGNNALFSKAYCDTVSASGSYLIKPAKNNDIVKANGVSVIDLYLIQAHILGKTLLGSPYKIIAADVNNDGTVSVTDLLFIKKLILGIDTTFPNNKLWAFVDSSYQFANPANPFPHKDSILVSNIKANQSGKSFVGLKLGDVNYDWNASTMGINNQFSVPLAFSYSAINTHNQTEIRVPIRVKNCMDMLGFQFTLNFDNTHFKLKSIENNTLNILYGTVHIPQGKISFLWNDVTANAITLPDSTVLMELVFDPLVNTENDSLSITSDVTTAEAWDANYQLHGVSLTSISPSNLTILNTNSWTVSPNPSDGNVVINFSLNESKSINFCLTSIDGKIVATNSMIASKGKNSIILNLNKQARLTPGIYFLKADGLDVNDTKKLLIR